MNIFRPMQSHTECAKFLDDSRLNKQIHELAQIFSSAIYRRLAYTPPDIYKPYNPNGRFVTWVLKTQANTNFCMAYAQALHEERLHRFSRHHSSFTTILFCKQHLSDLPEGPKHSLPGCEATIAIMTKNPLWSLERAYQQVLLTKWLSSSTSPRWTNRDKPQLYLLAKKKGVKHV